MLHDRFCLEAFSLSNFNDDLTWLAFRVLTFPRFVKRITYTSSIYLTSRYHERWHEWRCRRLWTDNFIFSSFQRSKETSARWMLQKKRAIQTVYLMKLNRNWISLFSLFLRSPPPAYTKVIQQADFDFLSVFSALYCEFSLDAKQEEKGAEISHRYRLFSASSLQLYRLEAWK